MKPNFSHDDFVKEMLRRKELIDQVITRSLSALGVKAVNHARSERGYIDRTGNLVNSTGFILLKDGVSVFEDFQKTTEGTEPTTVDGQQVGRSLALQIAIDFANFKGWALIVVAGMNYAASVEYLHSRNVLAATELWLRTEMVKTIASIQRSVNKMKV